MDYTITLDAPVAATPRVLQMASLFDVEVTDKARRSWNHRLPLEEQPWQVGLIVGPSGAGKTTLARRAFGDAVVTDFPWSPDKSLLDDFPAEMGIRDVVGLLTAVGLSSPPAWMRPFHTLSNGEAFRATIARSLAETEGLVVVDEFTSVVDRQVAQVASHTVQKAIRRQTGRQFVAVTCHYDVLDWLQPDWVYNVAGEYFTWRCLQRHPRLDLAIHPVDHSCWPVFRSHHYLSGNLHKAAKCFGAFLGEDCVGFTSYIHFPHPKTRNIKMGHRTVVLPDYQGLGLGGRLADWLGQYLYVQGFRYHRVIAHPAVIHHCTKSPRWRDISSRTKRLSSTSKDKALRERAMNPRFIGTRSFEYVPPIEPA